MGTALTSELLDERLDVIQPDLLAKGEKTHEDQSALWTSFEVSSPARRLTIIF